MEVLGLGVKSGLQLPAYTTAIQDPTYVCNLYHSSWHCQILNPLSEARGSTCILMVLVRLITAEPLGEHPLIQLLEALTRK